ncbi:MAG: cation diffusion facilitator family transporter [Bacteroidales bacterium]|nr:cation diffusion facilitator family transporter [Bacteroidales bacterium]
MNKQRFNQAGKVIWTGFFANLALTLFKLLAGLLGRSAAMVADAIHSVSDIITDLVIAGSLKYASRPSDGNHKYGHGKVETLAAAFVGGVLFAIGVGILYSGTVKIIGHFNEGPLQKPGMIAFYAALFSVVIKELLFRYTLKWGKRTESTVLIANAWHHRSDVYSSIGTLVGIGGAIFFGSQWVILDPLAAIIVSFFIFKVAVKIIREALLELIETSLPRKKEKEILEVAANVEGVYAPHDLKTRKIGSNIAIDLHIYVKDHLNIRDAHEITVCLEKRLREKYGEETHISVHTEPLAQNVQKPG